MFIRSGMIIYSLVFLAGVLLVQQFEKLPELSLFWSVPFAVAAIFSYRIRSAKYSSITVIIVYILLFYMGIIYSVNIGEEQLSYRLQESLAGKDISVTGHIIDAPVKHEDGQRFQMELESVKLPGEGVYRDISDLRFPRRIRLSWYHGETVNAGEKWRLSVRLKPPHGFQNPGGFDYEGWLYQQRIHATGYVKRSEENRLVLGSGRSLAGNVHHIRQKLAEQVDRIGLHLTAITGKDAYTAPLIKALAIGDKSGISKQQWEVLADTGTSHLLAISGLHIGLAYLFVYFLSRRLIPGFVMRYLPAQHIAALCGLLSSLLYAAMAGFSVPTQRAFVMLAVLVIMSLRRQNHRAVDTLGMALLVVLLIDPMSVLSAGFWFSFSAVAIIFISLSGQSDRDIDQTKHEGKHIGAESSSSCDWKQVFYSHYRRALTVGKSWLRLQLMISIFLVPMTLFMFQQASLISPLANLVMIPYVSLLVVPLVLVAITLTSISISLSDLVFMFAIRLLDLIWPVIDYLSNMPIAVIVDGQIGIRDMLVSISAILLIYYSAGIAHQVSTFLRQDRHIAQLRILIIALSVILISCSIVDTSYELDRNEFSLTVLDVGQGSSSVIQTANHALIFDSGARFSDRFDSGRNIVIPYLRNSGVEVIDTLVISHGDADHIGGAHAILDEYPDAGVIGRDLETINSINKQDCYRGLSWSWDGVNFEFLHPEPDLQVTIRKHRNNHSCVLKVSSEHGSLLLTGDIEREAERRLIEIFDEKLRSDVMIVPHHGSKTSSTKGFITAVDAEYAIFSIGYRNRYRLPGDQILGRYRDSEARILRTDQSGAIMLSFTEDDGISVEEYRRQTEKYWHHRYNP